MVPRARRVGICSTWSTTQSSWIPPRPITYTSARTSASGIRPIVDKRGSRYRTDCPTRRCSIFRSIQRSDCCARASMGGACTNFGWTRRRIHEVRPAWDRRAAQFGKCGIPGCFPSGSGVRETLSIASSAIASRSTRFCSPKCLTARRVGRIRNAFVLQRFGQRVVDDLFGLCHAGGAAAVGNRLRDLGLQSGFKLWRRGSASNLYQ